MKCGLLFVVKNNSHHNNIRDFHILMTLSRLMHSLPAFQMMPHMKLKMFQLIALLQWSVTFNPFMLMRSSPTTPGGQNCPWQGYRTGFLVLARLSLLMLSLTYIIVFCAQVMFLISGLLPLSLLFLNCQFPVPYPISDLYLSRLSYLVLLRS